MQVYKHRATECIQDSAPVLVPSTAPVPVTQLGEHISSSHESVTPSNNIPSLPSDNEVQFNLEQLIALHKGKQSCTLLCYDNNQKRNP